MYPEYLQTSNLNNVQTRGLENNKSTSTDTARLARLATKKRFVQKTQRRQHDDKTADLSKLSKRRRNCVCHKIQWQNSCQEVEEEVEEEGMSKKKLRKKSKKKNLPEEVTYKQIARKKERKLQNPWLSPQFRDRKQISLSHLSFLSMQCWKRSLKT